MNEKTQLLDIIRKYIEKSWVVVFGVVFTQILSMLFSMLMARVYAPAEFGVIQFTLSVSFFLSTILVLGTPNAITHFVAKSEKFGLTKLNRYLLLLAMSISVLFAIVLIFPIGKVLLFFNVWDDKFIIVTNEVGFYIVFFISLFNSLNIIIASYFRGVQNFIFLQFWDGILKRLIWILPLFFLSSYEYLLYLPCSFIILFLCALLWLVKNEGTVETNVNSNTNRGEIRKKFFSYALPLALTSVFVQQARSDLSILIVGILSSQNDVGLVKVAMVIGSIVGLVISLVNVAFFPIASSLVGKKNIALLILFYDFLVRCIWIIIVPFAILLCVFSKDLTVILFGSEYLDSVASVVVLIVGFSMNAVFGPVNNMILSMEMIKEKSVVEFLTFVIVIFLNFLLVPCYDALGAAIAIAIGNFFWNLCLYLLVCKKISKFDLVGWKNLYFLLSVVFVSIVVYYLSVNVFQLSLLPQFSLVVLSQLLVIVLFVKSFNVLEIIGQLKCRQ